MISGLRISDFLLSLSKADSNPNSICYSRVTSMRIRLLAFGVVVLVAALPVLANVCDLSCEMVPRQAAPPSCHEHGASPTPAGGSHTPKTCSHDHETMRAALKAPGVTLDAMGGAAIHALVHTSTTLLSTRARSSWDPARGSIAFAPPPLVPLRI